MKKLALCLMTTVLCLCTLCVPVMAEPESTFVPSVSAEGVPGIVTTMVDGQEVVGYIVNSADGTKLSTVYPGCLYIISLEEAQDENSKLHHATRQTLIDLYNMFLNRDIILSEDLEELNALVAEEFGEGNNADNMVLRDLFLMDVTHKECKDWLVKEGTTLDVTFEMDVEAGTFLQVATYIDGKWELVEKVVNHNEDDDLENDGTVTVTFEDLCPVVFLVPGEMNQPTFPWYWILIVLLIALGGYIVSKKGKKA